MFVIDREVEVAAPAHVVWQVLTDLPNYRQWNPFVPEVSSTLRPGDPIELQVNLRGKLSRQVEVMTAFDEGRGFSYRMKPAPLGALASAREQVIDLVSDSRCRYRSHFELRGWLSPLVRTVLQGPLQAGFDGMTRGLQQRAEALWAARKT